MFHVGQRNFDLKWCALEENLQAEGYTPDQIEAAKQQLVDVVRKPTSAITQEVKELYQKVFPKDRKDLILTIKKELLAFSEQKIHEVLSSPPELARTTLESLQRPNSYYEERLRDLGQLGVASATNWYFYFNYSSFESDEERQSRAGNIALKIIDDFKLGIPTSFPIMAEILYSRQFSYDSLTHLEPVSNINDSLKILHRLADLGDPIAQDGLFAIFTFNAIGEDHCKVELEQSTDQRIEGIKKLALDGHPSSQNELTSVCCHQVLGHGLSISFSELKRREWIQKLQEIEKVPNFYLQYIIKKNSIGDLPLNLDLETRFSILWKKTREGCNDAFLSLFKAYMKNKLGNDELHLPQEARLVKLLELKEINPTKGSDHFVDIYRDNETCGTKDRLQPNFTNEERIAWLEDQAFNQNNDNAIEIVAKALIDNELRAEFNPAQSIELNMPFAERMHKLFILAEKGCKIAQESLLAYYKLKKHCEKTIVHDAEECCEECYTLQSGVMIECMISWSFSDGNDSSRKFILRNIDDENVRKTVEYLYNNLEFAHMITSR